MMLFIFRHFSSALLVFFLWSFSFSSIYWPSARFMLCRRRRRWANINPELSQCIVFAGNCSYVFAWSLSESGGGDMYTDSICWPSVCWAAQNIHHFHLELIASTKESSLPLIIFLGTSLPDDVNMATDNDEHVPFVLVFLKIQKC